MIFKETPIQALAESRGRDAGDEYGKGFDDAITP